MTMRVSDEAIRDALRPGQGVAAPDHFMSSVMSTIAADAARGGVVARGRVRTGPTLWRPSSPWSFVLLILLLLLAVGAAVVIGSRLVPPTPRPVLPPGVFQPTGQIPNASDLQRPAVATLADGRVLIAGGNTDYARTALLFDPVSETFGDPIRMRASRWDATATTLEDGTVLVVGGMDPTTDGALANAESFDPRAGTFTTVEPMAVARADHTATLLEDGRVLITGGQQLRESEPGSQSFVPWPLASAELYDPVAGSFTTAGDMTSERVGHTATLLTDGTVLIVGGSRRAPDGTYVASASAEVFDPATGTFRSVPAMGTPRAEHTGTRLPDGQVLIVGGSTVFDFAGYGVGVSPSAEIYDSRTESFGPTGSLLTERADHSATLLPDGRVLIAGGYNPFGIPRTAELFDPVTGTFEPAGTATSDHRFATAQLLADGRVFFPESWGSELYDPNGRPSSGAGDIPSPATPSTGPSAFQPLSTIIRSGHSATLLDDGRVLIAGGFGGPDQTELSTAELFDPGSDTFTPTGSMSAARTFAVTNRLPDGRVLVAGGGPTEIYDPSSGTFGPATQEVLRWLDDDRSRFVAVSGLDDGRLVLERYVPGTETAPSREIMTLIDAVDGREIASTRLCGSGRFFGSPAAMLSDDRILILCGRDEPAQLFDPSSGATVSAGIQGDWVTATPLADGRIVLASRDGDSGAATLVVTGIYDPATATLQELPVSASSPANWGRRIEQHGSMAELTDGTVLVAGGFSGASDGAWLFDPATGATRSVGPMLAGREQPSVTALADGRALIVGGVTQSPDRTDPVAPGAELFDPRLSR